MKCKRCEDFYNKHPLEEKDFGEGHRNTAYGSPIRCAFDNDKKEFNNDNWNCLTMGELRSIVNTCNPDNSDRNFYGWCFRDDMCSGSFGVLWLHEDSDLAGYLCMTWYKRRGKTGQAYIMDDDSEPEKLKLEDAEKIIEYFKTK